MLSTPLPDCIETEINDTEVQLPLPENPAIYDLQQMLKDSDDVHAEDSDEAQIQQTPEDPDGVQIQQKSENPTIHASKVQKKPKNSDIIQQTLEKTAIRASKAQKESKNSEIRRRSTRVVKTRPEKVENTAKNKKRKEIGIQLGIYIGKIIITSLEYFRLFSNNL
ncbi:hypothetical protein C1646_722696 [Rhizophagus diaphanus]|nr:hypothetical protein C1646_722696 [Rhizophagus diaphanus] [Rhizophagus sp. MUCL 43196]